MSKITIGGVIAGVIMFLWSFVAHMVLPIGMMGISSTTNEDAVLAALKSANASGLYMMPGYEVLQAKSSAEQQAAMKVTAEKAKITGSAFIVYRPEGGAEINLKTLGLSLAADIVACWIFGFALWAAMPRIRTFNMRVWLVMIMGLLPFVLGDFGNWNWYEFPSMYGFGRALDYSVGAVFAGMFLAWWFGRNEA